MQVHRRLLLVAATVAALLAFNAPVASAAPPAHGSFDATWALETTDICPSFSISVSQDMTVTETDFTDQTGAVIRSQLQVVEQDTFTANGKTLIGDPVRYNVTIGFDSSDNPVSIVTTGGVLLVALPDGNVVRSAGRINVTSHPDMTFWAAPDTGHSGDIAAFCAALF
jgi:hypothetical protein